MPNSSKLSEKSKDKIIYENSIGIIYEYQIIVFQANKKEEILINDIASFRIIKRKDTTVNLMFFLLSSSFFGLSFIINSQTLEFITCCLAGLFFLVLSMFYTKSIYYLQIVLCIAQQIMIRINKKEKKEAFNFVKKLESYKGSNPNLMTLNY